MTFSAFEILDDKIFKRAQNFTRASPKPGIEILQDSSLKIQSEQRRINI